MLQQYLPFTVLKRNILITFSFFKECISVATVLTVYGIETFKQETNSKMKLSCCNSTYRLRYWNHLLRHQIYLLVYYSCNSTYRLRYWNHSKLQAFLMRRLEVATVLTVYGIETLKLKILFLWMWFGSCNSAYRLRYWNLKRLITKTNNVNVATVLTACGMRRRVRDSRGAKRRWGPHISSPWPEERENKGDKVTVLTVYGIEENITTKTPSRLIWSARGFALVILNTYIVLLAI